MSGASCGTGFVKNLGLSDRMLGAAAAAAAEEVVVVLVVVVAVTMMMNVPFRNCSARAALQLTQVRSRADDKHN